MTGKIDVQAINRSSGLVVTEDGRTFPMTNLIDCFGDETGDLDEAVAAVCGKQGVWFVVHFSDFTPISYV